ncbi:MAG: helix-turn-helix transcriptional regulator [Clostridiales bacterium]|nr:helix-turn-helix transcriptional regulator [Clostridiales bacterium]
MNTIDRIKQARNLSYEDIAKECGVTATYVYQLAKGKRKNPNVNIISKIANFLGVTIEELIEEEKCK